MHFSTRNLPRHLAAIVVLAAGAAASAQSGNTKPDEPLLKGPQVKDRDVPGVMNSFGEGQGARRLMGERIPPEVLREAFGVLTADDAPEAIRATDEQKAKFETITGELRAAVRAYMAEHREELIELRKDANLSGRAAQEIDRAIGRRPGQGGNGGGSAGDARRERAAKQGDSPAEQAPMMDEADQEKQEAARQRLREIMSGAPKIEDYITRVWEGLSSEQRTAVEARLDEYRERESKKREEAYVRQRVGERQKGADEARAEAARKSAPADDMMSDKMTDRSDTEPPRRPAAASAERRERLLRIFERMSPEQQETLLERLENLARERPAAAAENRRGPARKGDVSKPPPAMDDVDVPRQDEVEKPARRNPD